MFKRKQPYVCPAELSGSLDNIFRRWLHKPARILSPYVRNGMTILDLGCGPGYFTVELARLTGKEGKVIAADLQPGMLEKMSSRVRDSGFGSIVQEHLCSEKSIDVSEPVDFILAFWMVHEVPDQSGLFRELKAILKPEGSVLIVEPVIHVTGKEFRRMTEKANSEGFKVAGNPSVPISRALLLTN